MRTAQDYLQKPCSFIAPDGRELAGMIVECVETTPFGPGAIPDYRIVVRGSSGRTMSVSLVESHLKTTDL